MAPATETKTPIDWASAKGSFDRERLFLRKALYDHVAQPSGADCGVIVGHAVANGIIKGDTAKTTPSYIRDALHPNVLAALIAKVITWDDVKRAVTDPNREGVKNASGFSFGYPKALDSDVLAKARGVLDTMFGAAPTGASPESEEDEEGNPVASTDNKTEQATQAVEAIPGAPVPGTIKTFSINPEFAQLVDVALSKGTSQFRSAADLKFYIEATEASVSRVRSELETALKDKKAAEDQAEAMREKLANTTSIASGPVEIKPVSGEIPKGKMVQKKMGDVFGIGGEMLIPSFEWDTPHPHVPNIDPFYDFDEAKLVKLMWALIQNKKTWLHGHTGTGKSTFVEQVCARLKWPFMRVNLDSEITRMDMLGRDTLTVDPVTKTTVSQFVHGIVPKAMSIGAVLCVDEVSFGRPDVMYVFQRILEDKGLMLTENGSELVVPNPFFRIIATCNTKGQGDEWGAYQGARAQSGAFLDRFTCWIGFDYLKADREQALIMKLVPGMTSKLTHLLVKTANEVRLSFKNGDILQTMSPRGLQACGEALVFMSNFRKTKPGAAELKEALDLTLLDKASDTDRQVIKGIIDRVVKD